MLYKNSSKKKSIGNLSLNKLIKEPIIMDDISSKLTNLTTSCHNFVGRFKAFFLGASCYKKMHQVIVSKSYPARNKYCNQCSTPLSRVSER